MDPVSWTELRQSQVRVRSPKGTSLESEPHASYGDLERYYPPKSSQQSLSQKSELVMGMSLGVPSKRHQLGRC